MKAVNSELGFEEERLTGVLKERGLHAEGPGWSGRVKVEMGG